MKRIAWIAAGAIGLVSCQSAQIADLARNERLCSASTFVTRSPGTRELFVAPVGDERALDASPASLGGFPIAYDGDGRWSRPPQDMIGDALRRDLAHSRIFSAVLPAARPDALVLVPSIAEFHSGMAELEMGARSFADIAIRARVYGPSDDRGRRELLHDQIYGVRESSSAAIVPMSTYVLAGRALRGAIARLLRGLDASNVSRADVPAVLGLGGKD
ncbi:MAG: hypothetical protein Fur0037_25830 [Planctomycetota bacterium]